MLIIISNNNRANSYWSKTNKLPPVSDLLQRSSAAMRAGRSAVMVQAGGINYEVASLLPKVNPENQIWRLLINTHLGGVIDESSNQCSIMRCRIHQCEAVWPWPRMYGVTATKKAGMKSNGSCWRRFAFR
jgi:hypothetical protein